MYELPPIGEDEPHPHEGDAPPYAAPRLPPPQLPHPQEPDCIIGIIAVSHGTQVLRGRQRLQTLQRFGRLHSQHGQNRQQPVDDSKVIPTIKKDKSCLTVYSPQETLIECVGTD